MQPGSETALRRGPATDVQSSVRACLLVQDVPEVNNLKRKERRTKPSFLCLRNDAEKRKGNLRYRTLKFPLVMESYVTNCHLSLLCYHKERERTRPPNILLGGFSYQNCSGCSRFLNKITVQQQESTESVFHRVQMFNVLLPHGKSEKLFQY